MSMSDDPDWDAWLEAENTTPEELEAQIAGATGASIVISDAGGSWRLRPLADTKPLEEFPGDLGASSGDGEA